MTKEKQITEINLPSGRYLVVRTYGYTPKSFVIKPADENWTVQYLKYMYWAKYMTVPGGHWVGDEIPIEPEGNWQIMGTADKITEQEWKEIVESDWWYDGPQEQHGLGRVDYYREYPKDLEDSCLLTATESGHSLIRSHGYEIGECVVLKDNG